ncbi:MAG: hypothetical protein ABIT04_02810 [Novosphingobium sp.]
MRAIILTALALLLAPPAVAAEPAVVAHYRVAEGPDVAGELVLTADGRFAYELAAGALDERAEGRWARIAGRPCLTTEPVPVSPSFALGPRRAAGPEATTLLVTWPNGRGIAGVDFVIGFATGEPVTGYTQEYGWTLPHAERRAPAWIELTEPIHRTASTRFALRARDVGTIVAVLTPNDLGVVDFRQACIDPRDDGAVLHRAEGDMRLVPVR